jgi:hypothetical protein
MYTIVDRFSDLLESVNKITNYRSSVKFVKLHTYKN